MSEFQPIGLQHKPLFDETVSYTHLTLPTKIAV